MPSKYEGGLRRQCRSRAEDHDFSVVSLLGNCRSSEDSTETARHYADIMREEGHPISWQTEFNADGIHYDQISRSLVIHKWKDSLPLVKLGSTETRITEQ